MHSTGAIHCFIDSQVFISQNFDWNRSVFRRMTQYTKTGTLILLTTQIVKSETKRHLKIRRNELQQNINKLQQKAGMISGVLNGEENRLLQLDQFLPNIVELEASLTRFFDENQFISIDNSECSIDELFSLYFAGKKPFGIKGKKSEFPDAANLILLTKYRKNNCDSLFVVSGDSDWEQVCSSDDNLHYFSDLNILLDTVEQQIQSNKTTTEQEAVTDTISDFKNGFEYYKSDILQEIKYATEVNHGDGVLDELSCINLNLIDISENYVDSDKNYLFLSADVQVSFNYFAHISLLDSELDSWLEKDIEGTELLEGSVNITAEIDEGIIQNIDVQFEYFNGLNLQLESHF